MTWNSQVCCLPGSAQIGLRKEMGLLAHTIFLSITYAYFATGRPTSWSSGQGLLTTNHEVPGSIPGSTMEIFPCRERFPVVTMVWVVSRFRLKATPCISSSCISPLTHHRNNVVAPHGRPNLRSRLHYRHNQEVNHESS